jgi:hypothetical protein
MSGLNRHYYDCHYWPEKIESCHDEKILSWLEEHIALIPMFPRPDGTSVIEGRKVTAEGVKALADAAADCWNAIMNMDLQSFARAYQASFEAQIAMFPAMMNYRVKEYIDRYRDQVLAWKMAGAGGGGYLAVVFDDTMPEGALPIKIRRKGLQ